MDTVTLALSSRIDLSHAPIPTNPDERLAYRQLFETLVRVDCQGELRPGLANAWRSDSTGRTFTFTIRDGVSPDGSRLTARSIESDWRRRLSDLQREGLDSVRAIDDRDLRVTMRDVHDSLPGVFAGPAWSVVLSRGAGTALGARTRILTGSSHPVVELVVWPGGDLRDALDEGADLVVSGDPHVFDYAQQRREFAVLPLPWDRTYALLQHPGTEPLTPMWDSTVRQSLARDVVRTDARPAQSRYWWNSGPCSVDMSMKLTVPPASRIVYSQGDPVARQLAERIVAVAEARSPLSAVGMDPMTFAAALARGEDRGYIVAIPLQSASPCLDSAAWSRQGSLWPLIDTRQRAIIRRGSPALSLDYDGTVRVRRGHDLEEETLP